MATTTVSLEQNYQTTESQEITRSVRSLKEDRDISWSVTLYGVFILAGAIFAALAVFMFAPFAFIPGMLIICAGVAGAALLTTGVSAITAACQENHIKKLEERLKNLNRTAVVVAPQVGIEHSEV